MTGISRKQFLQLAALGGVSASMPALANDPPPLDVIVIGAGLAGLSAARNLTRLGLSVVVLEARGRVGGRTVNLDLPGGHVVEGGGEWIGPGQDRIAALADQLGIGTFPAFYRGSTTYEIGGVVSTGLLPDLDAKQGYDFVTTATKLDRLSRQLPLGRPWDAKMAHSWDHRTLGDWLSEHATTGFTHDVFRLITRAIVAGYPERISLLWFLWYLRSAGGLLPLILNDGGAQDLRFDGGSQRLSLEMAEQLGHRIYLNHPVMSIRDVLPGLVQVKTHQRTFSARRAVVAMMPGDIGRMDFAPTLPSQRKRLINGWARLTRLPIVKLSVAYDRPFWRALGLNGAMQSDRAPIQLVFDNSPEDGSIGVLSCFMSVVEAPGFADRTRRKHLVLQELARYFGPEALNIVAYVEKDWATDPWSSGCITPLGPGLLTDAGPCLRTPVGRIHWAGTETAVQWCGFMDGAVRSGERVAQEVAQAIRGSEG
jgi:monoamine oxidase